MANALYAKGRNSFLNGEISFESDTINMALVADSYTPDLNNDEFWSDVVANLVDSPQTLSGKTTDAGIANCSDVTFPAVPGGSTVGYVVVYKNTGSAATSPLIACFDTATGIPISTSGADITIAIDTGANKLFKL